MSSYLDVFAGVLQLLESELTLAGVQGGRRGEAGAPLTVGTRHRLHRVGIVQVLESVFDPSAGSSTQRPDDTLTATVGPLGERLHLIVVAEELPNTAHTKISCEKSTGIVIRRFPVQADMGRTC